MGWVGSPGQNLCDPLHPQERPESTGPRPAGVPDSPAGKHWLSVHLPCDLGTEGDPGSLSTQPEKFPNAGPYCPPPPVEEQGAAGFRSPRGHWWGRL